MWPRAHHEEVFARDDLDDYIDAAVYTSEMPVAKPHAEAFRMILDALGLARRGVRLRGRPAVGRRRRRAAGGHAGHLDPALEHPRLPGARTTPRGRTPSPHRLLDVFAIVESWQ